ncbi:unnamed protein product [Ectocarpus sp. 8 AP-2014]
MSVIVYTLDSSTDGDEEFVAQIIETVTGSAYYPTVDSEIYLQPTPLATAVKIEADLPAGDWFSILETYIYVTLEDDEVSSSGSSVSGSLISVLVFALIFCCCGCFLYAKFCDGWHGASASASASSSASAAATNNVSVVMPQMSYGQQMPYGQQMSNGQ